MRVELKYGVNPHQTPAYFEGDPNPITVLNGQLGAINLLDALNGWQLVRELKQATGLPSATSFKHVSPAGAAVAVPLTNTLRQAYFLRETDDLSPLATAFARARGADRVSSFGDWIALSDQCDESTARLIKREVSDGVIAPSYSREAIEILKQKKGGDYRIVQIDPSYEPPALEESKQVFGINFVQRRNDAVVSPNQLTNIPTNNQHLTDKIIRDMLIANITLKYTQSNSVCYVKDGQTIGVGAGQQSRIHCTRLAGDKADLWWLRQHPAVLDLPFREKLGRPARDNAVDQFLVGDLTEAEEVYWLESFAETPTRLTDDQRAEWLGQLSGVVLGSDAFFPFRDSIDRASRSGVTAVVQPGGSIRDDVVIEACNGYGMVMAFTGTRLFHH